MLPRKLMFLDACALARDVFDVLTGEAEFRQFAVVELIQLGNGSAVTAPRTNPGNQILDRHFSLSLRPRRSYALQYACVQCEEPELIARVWYALSAYLLLT